MQPVCKTGTSFVNQFWINQKGELLGYFQTVGSQKISFEDTMSLYNDQWLESTEWSYTIIEIESQHLKGGGQVLNDSNIFILSDFSIVQNSILYDATEFVPSF